MGDFAAFVLIGFVAQLADGAMGTGFGVICSTPLLAQGTPAPMVLASVDAAKLPTGAVAAVSPAVNGNVDRGIVRRLLATGRSALWPGRP